MYEPCSPGSPNSLAVTLQQLADQGKASQVWQCARQALLTCLCSIHECSGLTPLPSMPWQADLHFNVQVHPPDISFRDFEKVMLRARPTVSKDDLGIFEKYKNEFGGFIWNSAAALLKSIDLSCTCTHPSA
jgi:Vps4 C terminal oligomerisation domain